MEIQQQNRPCLETIQEESELKDKFEGSETGGEEEEEEEDFQIQVGVETKEVTSEDKSKEDEDNDALFRGLRPKKLSRSISQDSSLEIQSSNNHHKEIENFSDSDWSTHRVDLRDKATPPWQTKLGNKRSINNELRIKNLCRKRRLTKQKAKMSKKRKKGTSLEEPFPDWLVNLMVNIEEATTHQLVVE